MSSFRKCKRIITPLLGVVLILASVVSASAGQTNPFKDVKESDWFYKGVQYVYEHNLMVGTDPTSFDPKGEVTRAMMVTVLYNYEGKPASAKASFPDVAGGKWYTPAVGWAAANKIVSGYTDGTFRPNDKITREQMATVLYNYAAYKKFDTSKSADLSKYSDASSVAKYAKKPMAWANAYKIINGMSDTILSPKSNATRAQLAAIFMNFRETFKSGGEPNPSPASKATPTPASKPTPKPSKTSYTVSFNMNGVGTQVESQNIAPGGKITQPKYPNDTKGEAVFCGWHTKQSGISKWDFDNMTVSSDMTLYAHWCYPDNFKAAAMGPENARTLYIYYDCGQGAPQGSTSLGSLPSSALMTSDWPWADETTLFSKIVIDESVKNYEGLHSTSRMFSGFYYAESISGLQYLVMDNVDNMACMFESCGFTKIEGIADWNTQNVTNMTMVFNSISAADSAPDVSRWDVSKVKDMHSMFCGYGSASTKLAEFPDLSKWHTGSLERVDEMFGSYGANSDNMHEKLLDLSSFDTSHVSDLQKMEKRPMFSLLSGEKRVKYKVRFGKGWTIPTRYVFQENVFNEFLDDKGIRYYGTSEYNDMDYQIGDLQAGKTITFTAQYK